MMIEHATVVDYQNGIATVQCFAKSSCGGCVAQGGCGTKSLSALAGEKIAPRFELAVSETLEVGEQIQLGLPEQTLLFGVWWLYCLPLLTVVLSTLIFSTFVENELWVAFGILSCTVLTFWAVKKRISHLQQCQFEPVYLGRVNHG